MQHQSSDVVSTYNNATPHYLPTTMQHQSSDVVSTYNNATPYHPPNGIKCNDIGSVETWAPTHTDRDTKKTFFRKKQKLIFYSAIGYSRCGVGPLLLHRWSVLEEILSQLQDFYLASKCRFLKSTPNLFHLNNSQSYNCSTIVIYDYRVALS